MRHEARGIVIPTIISDPVVFVADEIIDDGIYYLLNASTVSLLLLLLLLHFH